jgi:hypothetical protein
MELVLCCLFSHILINFNVLEEYTEDWLVVVYIFSVVMSCVQENKNITVTGNHCVVPRTSLLHMYYTQYEQ